MDQQEAKLYGQHLIVNRGAYKHHGIYVGNGEVIHYGGLATDVFDKDAVSATSYADFKANGEVWVRVYKTGRLSVEDTVRRAKSRVGENRYSLLFNNCEHFATWCATGLRESRQIDRWAPHWTLLSIIRRSTLPALRSLQWRKLIGDWPLVEWIKWRMAVKDVKAAEFLGDSQQ